jgi:hypothetical protein
MVKLVKGCTLAAALLITSAVMAQQGTWQEYRSGGGFIVRQPLESVLRPNGPSPHAPSRGRGVPTKLAGPDLAPVARDCDHPPTGERAAIRRALRCGQTRIGVMCHHSWGDSSVLATQIAGYCKFELGVVNKL